MFLAHDIAFPDGILRRDGKILQPRRIEIEQQLEIGLRAGFARRCGVPVARAALGGPAIHGAVRDQAHAGILVLGIAPDQHQVFEIMREPATLAVGFIEAAGMDDHLELGRRAGLVANQEQPFADALLGGEGRRREQHIQQQGKRCPQSRQTEWTCHGAAPVRSNLGVAE